MSALANFRASVEAMVQAGIDLLDAIDAPTAEMEAGPDQETISEDDGLVKPWPDRALRGGSDEA